MSDPRVPDLGTMDPAEVVCAWEAVEELLQVVPEGTAKDVLRLVAAGLGTGEIAERLELDHDEVDVLAARARIRVLTAAASGAQPGGTEPRGRARPVERRAGPRGGAPR